MKISIGNKLMSGSRYAALALTVITSLAAGLWVSNAVAVEKIYHTDTGSGDWVCGGTPAQYLNGILTDSATYACASDTLTLDERPYEYISFMSTEAYQHDTTVDVTDATFWLGDNVTATPLDVSLRFVLGMDPWVDNWFFDSKDFIGGSVGSNTLSFSGGPVMIPAGSLLKLSLLHFSSDSGSYVRLGNSHDALGSIRFSVTEEALCTSPVTNLSASDISSTSATLTWDSNLTLIPADAYKIYRNGELMATTTDTYFTDNTFLQNASYTYTYAVRNYNTADSCDGPDTVLAIRDIAAKATPGSYDFGNILVDDSSVKAFIISNTASSEPVTVSSVTLSGILDSAYSITTGFDACTDAVLAFAESCSIVIKFSPSNVGVKDARLNVHFDGTVATIAIPLKGGIRPHLVKDIHPGSNSSFPQNLTNANGTTFFETNNSFDGGAVLWKTDATGTSLVKDALSGGPIEVFELYGVNDNVFFGGHTGDYDFQLWKSDGTSAGTGLVKNIGVGGNISWPMDFTNVNGTVFFYNSLADGELWKTDGTEAGTVLVKDIHSGSNGSSPTYLTNVDGVLYFTANDGINGAELWKSDGTEAGTVLVKDIYSGSNGSSPECSFGVCLPGTLTNVSGVLYFIANDGINGVELWKSDGTPGGTVLVKDINSGTGNSDLSNLTNINGVLYFTANDGINGAELWKSDGTPAGTVLVKDINSGTGSSGSSNLTNVSGVLYFEAYDGINGTELWKSDGTLAGTVLVKDIRSGPTGSNPSNLINVDDVLYFVANDGTHGAELWVSDGTSAGTYVMDIRPGSAHSSPSGLFENGGALFFSSNDGAFGTELWSINPSSNSPPSISPIADQETYDKNTLDINFSISDQDSVVSCSDVVATSGNTSVLPNSNILITTNTDQSCSVQLTPDQGAAGIGNSLVTLTLTDETQTTSTSFTANWYEAIAVGSVIGVSGVEHTNISSAITAAVSGDIIIVTDGVYEGAANRDIDFGGKNIILKSVNGSQQTTIDCNFSGRAFLYQNGETGASVLEGFTIQNCESEEFGGAIFMYDASPSIINNRFIRNFAKKGGGAIYLEGAGSPLIKGNSFVNNIVFDGDGDATGGAIMTGDLYTGTLTVENCEFENNKGVRGGAIGGRSEAGEYNVVGSRFMNNTASYGGGALSFYNLATISHSNFTGNKAVEGGAISREQEDNTVPLLKVSNSVFVKNSARGSGGAIRIIGAATLNNVSFYANTAESAGAISFHDWGNPYSVTITNSIFWENSAESRGNQIGKFSSGVIGLTLESSVLQGGVSDIDVGSPVLSVSVIGNVLDIDPLFAMDNNLRLMPGSPAIDAGTNNPPGGLSATDYDGVSRSLDSDNDGEITADMGAFEFDPANPNKIAVSSTTFSANATAKGSPPESQPLTLRNIGGGSTQWLISEDLDWLWFDTESGTTTDTAQTIRLFINHSALANDKRIYHGTIDIIDANSGYLYHRLSVSLSVNQVLRVGTSDYPTIQSAIDVSIDGDTVLVPADTYSLLEPIDLRAKAITLRGELGSRVTIIDASGISTGIVLKRGEDRRTVIEGLSITNANDAGVTGGLNVSATFVDLRIFDNNGDGMLIGGSSQISNSVIEGNTGTGLKIAISGAGAEVIDSKFSENTGGGIEIKGDDVTVSNSEFRNNGAENLPGSGIRTDSADRVALLNNVFQGNMALEGGGVYSDSSDYLKIVNSLFYQNNAKDGGGIYAIASKNLQVINNTLADNSASGSGQNIYTEGRDAGGNGTLFVTNSILYSESNTNTIEGGIYIAVTVSHSTLSAALPAGMVETRNVNDDSTNIFDDPRFVDAAGDSDDDFRLAPTSKSINAGTNIPGLFSDIRGSIRPVGGDEFLTEAKFDIGAYEFSEFYGDENGDGIAKAFQNLTINGAQQVVGFEYVIHWDDKNPFPGGDLRIDQAGKYDVTLVLVSDAGLRIEIDTLTVDVAAGGYNHYFTFAPEHIGDWKLRVELAADPNQFVESADIFIRYKEVTEYSLGTEIIAPADADRSQKPEVDNEAIVYWSIETNRLYAVGPGTTVVTWYEDEQRENPIPVVAQLVYPANPKLHITNTQPVTLLPTGSPFDAVATKYADNDASIGGNNFTATIEGWSVLLFRDNDNPDPEQREKFEVVRSYDWDHEEDPDDENDNTFPIDRITATIGKAITDAYHDPACKNGYAFFEDGFYDGQGVNKAYDRDTREGPIFAVNRDLTGDIQDSTSPQDDLVIVWYKQSPSTQVCWPSKPVHYDAQWPTAPEDFDTIVIASAMGSGPLAPDTYGLSANMVIYNQPDRAVLGYNPNEEHAAFFTAQGSTYPGVFPLRSDLNKSDTSESYTLLKYREPRSNEWNMKVFKVVADSKRFRSASGSIMAASANDDRYCLNSIGSVTPQVSCVDASYYLDSDGKLVNSAKPALCYQPTSVGGAIAATACPSVNSYSLNANGALQVSSTDPTSVEYSLDQHGVLVDKDIYYRFHYNAIAGSEINPPYPLNQFTFGPCTESFINPASVEYVLRDKDQKKLAYQGDVDVKLNYFYKLQEGFLYDLNSDGYPDKTVGTCVAWLEDLDAVVDQNGEVVSDETPVETTYAIAWPEQVPTLFVGETLVDAKTQTGEPVGLPNIGDQCQVDVLYDAPIVNSAMNYSNYSVNLIDPLTEYSSVDYPLGNPENELPGNLKPKKDLATGRWVFTALPYHLQSRLTYDEVDEQLKLKGSYSAGVGEPFLLMNVLSQRDLAIINTTLTEDPKKGVFDLQVSQANNKAISARDYPTAEYTSLKGAELKALTAGDANGTGYVTLAFNNHLDCPAPTVLSVINVSGPLYEGDIKVIEAPNPFEEKVTLKHNADFGGNTDGRAFQWVYTPADFSGVPCREGGNVNDPASCVTRNWLAYEPSAPADELVPLITDEGKFYEGAADTVIQGSGQQLLPDKWFSVRYNFEGTDVSESISAWTAPQLYEGWLKRVMKNINLYDQKVKDFHATSANTTADMISLAGQPYEGAVALSDDPEYLQDLGLIEAYETLLERANSLTSDNGSFTDINTAKLFASNRIADLYMLLGNEAYGDAADPTIGFSVNGAVYGSKASSIHSFQNQADSLLEEELKLLRGADNAGNRPYYNRLVWNFTLGDGEVAYKENYNISDNNTDGEINEQDAMIQFPQGHGDAWGHYLSASKKYYNLLNSTSFDWVPLSENILVAGTPVQVDYRDERKFATVAAAKAKSGAEIVNLTYRDAYTADPDGQWQGYKDIDPTRAWGVDGWSRRAGQGALFDWVTGNAILPATADLAERSYIVIVENGQTQFTLPYYESDPANPSLTLAVTRGDDALNYADIVFDSNNQPVVTVIPSPENGDVLKFIWNVPATSIQKVDRSTVAELWDVAVSYQSIEAEVDKANAGLNPLGLVSDAVPFDIDPSAVAAGQTHFEQIYDRAVQAMNNAIAVFNHANESSQLMRRQQDTLADFQRNVVNSEADYNNRLIEVYGYPYADDCGPGKTYSTDYCNNGPDLYHYMYVDASKLMGLEQPKVHEFDVLMKAYGGVTALGVPLVTEQEVTYHVATDSRFGIIKPPTWSSRRKAPGEIQLARSELLQLRGRFDKAIGEYDDLVYSIELQTQLIKDQFNLNANEIWFMRNDIAIQQTLNSFIKVQRGIQIGFRTAANIARNVGDAVAEAVPTSIGFSNDIGAPARSAIKNVATVVGQVLDLQADVSTILELGHQQAKEITAAETSIRLATDRGEFAIKQQVLQIENMVRNEATLRLEMYTLAEGLQQSASRYLSVLAKGDRLLRDRLRIRTQTAAQIQDYRYKDMTFRLFRNDALQKYRAQFDMASMYVYLAAKAYDYETTLLDSSSLAGQHFLTDIIKQRSIGQIENGQPLTGSGLADPMKRMWQNFQVLKPQLGFNNPQQETNRFSLRQEMMRITLDTGSHATWREALQASRVDNLWDNQDYRRYMRAFGSEGVAEPGLIIPFSTTVTPGLNFFRWPLGGGDSYYDSSNFATKISSVGVWFSNYNAVGLAQTPRIYLVPVGEDRLRTPSNDVNDIRTWHVVDQKLPAPFPIVDTEMKNDANWIPSVDTLFDEMFQIRQHSRFRAYHDSGYINQSELQYDSRLIGRSVWNSRWLLVIPGRSLLYDANEGLDTFIEGPESIFGTGRTGNGISDIKLFFETYSYSGN